MSTLKSANVTKYDAGGSGDNYIEDGYIKSVEKVWIDSYTTTTTTLESNDSICIGYVPKNKKLTEVTVYLPILGSDEASLATIFLDTGATILYTAANTFLGNMIGDELNQATFDLNTVATMRLAPGKFATVMPKRVPLFIAILGVDGLGVTETSGTIRSIIKYT